MSPDIVLADEPTGNVDWEMSERLLRLLLELNRMGKTVVIASHDLSLIRSAKSQVQARVLRIANKRLQLAGAKGALFSALAALFVGDLQRDRVVPASGYTSTLTSLTAAAMAFLVVFALALSPCILSLGTRLVGRWNNPQPCAFRPLSNNWMHRLPVRLKF